MTFGGTIPNVRASPAVVRRVCHVDGDARPRCSRDKRLGLWTQVLTLIRR